jgi:hypothetical protein
MNPISIGLGLYATSDFLQYSLALPVGGGTTCLVAGVDNRELHNEALTLRFHHYDVTRRRVVPDNLQIDFSQSVESNVDTWYGRILGGLQPDQWLIRYHRAVGFNEMYGNIDQWPFLVAIERALCKKLHKVNIPYAAISASVGTIDPPQFVKYFATLCAEADAISAHMYVAPHRTTLEPTSNPWYARRPYAWWQACKTASIVMPPLIATESGTFLSPKDTGMSSSQTVALFGQISTMLAEWRAEGMQILGHCPFGFGLEGNNAIWNLDHDALQLMGVWNARPDVDRTIPWTPKKKVIVLPDNYTSPNHGGLRTTIKGCVIHSTRGGASTLQNEYEATVRHFHDPAPINAQTGQHDPDLAVSADGVAGPHGQTHFPCPKGMITWHARWYNQDHRGIELVQPHHGDSIPDDVMDTGARMVASWWLEDKAAGHIWPLTWGIGTGLAEHWEIPPGIQDRKSDVQSPFDRAKFLKLVQHYAGVDDLTDAQKKAVLDDCDFLWAYSKADQIVKNPAESERIIHERIVALKVTLGLQ